MLLSDYFPTGLARDIKKAVTIEPKVLASFWNILTLDADGVASIVDFDNDEEQPKVIKIIRHICDIFIGRFKHQGDIPEMMLLTNTNKIISILELKWRDYDDIIHISIGTHINIYTNIRGEVTIEPTPNGKFTKINFPEPIVATTITKESILFLDMSGTVRLYYTQMQSESPIATFEELTPSFWRDGMKKEGDLEKYIMENLDEEYFVHDVIRVFPGTGYVLTLGNILVDTSDWRRENHNDVVYFASPVEGSELELLLNKRIKVNDRLISHIKDIIAISSDINLALVQADGRVLIKHYIQATFTTIPRLRLVVR